MILAKQGVWNFVTLASFLWLMPIAPFAEAKKFWGAVVQCCSSPLEAESDHLYPVQPNMRPHDYSQCITCEKGKLPPNWSETL